MTTPGSKEHLLSLFNSRKYTDLVIECGDKTFHVHKALICENKFFEKCCGTENFKEGKDGIVTIEEADPHAVWAVLLYLYCGDYADVLEKSDQSPLMLHTNVYVQADMWEVEGLCDLALSEIRVCFKEGEYSTKQDLDAHILRAAKTIYQNTPESHASVRDLFAREIFQKSSVLFGSHADANMHAENREQLESIPSLVIAMATLAVSGECACSCHAQSDHVGDYGTSDVGTRVGYRRGQCPTGPKPACRKCQRSRLAELLQSRPPAPGDIPWYTMLDQDDSN